MVDELRSAEELSIVQLVMFDHSHQHNYVIGLDDVSKIKRAMFSQGPVTFNSYSVVPNPEEDAIDKRNEDIIADAYDSYLVAYRNASQPYEVYDRDNNIFTRWFNRIEKPSGPRPGVALEDNEFHRAHRSRHEHGGYYLYIEGRYSIEDSGIELPKLEHVPLKFRITGEVSIRGADIKSPMVVKECTTDSYHSMLGVR